MVPWLVGFVAGFRRRRLGGGALVADSREEQRDCQSSAPGPGVVGRPGRVACATIPCRRRRLHAVPRKPARPSRPPRRCRTQAEKRTPGGRRRVKAGSVYKYPVQSFQFQGTFPMAFAPVRGRSTFSAPANARSKRAHISRRCGQPHHVRYRGCSRARRKSCPTAKLSTEL